MNDLISRQAATKHLKHRLYETAMNNDDLAWVFSEIADNRIETWIEELPSAQPEIIHCGECKHRDPEDYKCDCGHDILWQLPRDDKWYCADAGRRTDGRSDKQTGGD